MGLCRYLKTSENYLGFATRLPSHPQRAMGVGPSAGEGSCGEPLRLCPLFPPFSGLGASRGEWGSKQPFRV